MAPEISFAHLDHGPTRSAEPRQSDLVPAPVDTARVEEVALHLYDDREGPVCEVDSAYPSVVVAEVDLTLEGNLTGTPQDILEATLETALNRSMIGIAAENQSTQCGGAAGSSPAREARPSECN